MKSLEFTLWPACVKTHAFEDQVRAASSAGFDALPIGPLTYRELRERGYSPGKILDLTRNEGIALGHFDGFGAWAPLRYDHQLPEAARAVFDVSVDECLKICGELELKAICATAAFAPGKVPVSAMIDSFGEFCLRAAGAGLRVDLESIPMWGIPDLATAWTIVRESGANNAGVLLDIWHFSRGNPDMSLLREMPPGSIATVQLADATSATRGADLFEDCMRFRRLPGKGELAVVEILEILRDKGGVTSIGPEIFADELDRLDAEEAAQRCASASKDVLARAGWSIQG